MSTLKRQHTPSTRPNSPHVPRAASVQSSGISDHIHTLTITSTLTSTTQLSFLTFDIWHLSLPQVTAFLDIPDPPIGCPAADDPYYMLTLDSRIQDMNILTHSRQPAYEGYYPIKMPTPARYIKAMFLLYLRDLAGQRTLGHWKIELNYLISYVLEDGVNLQLDDLAEPFREWAGRQIPGV
ncbi:hypothetical protein MAP00_002446 [Monascus purpureus]|nr:hypothetical protein MAP00_002446 [Monascus purpureus]